jgi:hypothetical protein
LAALIREAVQETTMEVHTVTAEKHDQVVTDQRGDH